MRDSEVMGEIDNRNTSIGALEKVEFLKIALFFFVTCIPLESLGMFV